MFHFSHTWQVFSNSISQQSMSTHLNVAFVTENNRFTGSIMSIKHWKFLYTFDIHTCLSSPFFFHFEFKIDFELSARAHCDCLEVVVGILSLGFHRKNLLSFVFIPFKDETITTQQKPSIERSDNDKSKKIKKKNVQKITWKEHNVIEMILLFHCSDDNRFSCFDRVHYINIAIFFDIQFFESNKVNVIEIIIKK